MEWWPELEMGVDDGLLVRVLGDSIMGEDVVGFYVGVMVEFYG